LTQPACEASAVGFTQKGGPQLPQKNMIERAYELAGTGSFTKATEICRELSKEGYLGAAILLNGGGFRRDIRTRIRFARIAASLVSSA